MSSSPAVRRVLIALLCVVLLIALWGLSKTYLDNPDGDSGGGRPPNELPTHVEDSGTLEIPGESVLGASSFPVTTDRKYLVQLSLAVEKPEDSPGRATYVGYTLSCVSDRDGAETVSVGGTQNLVNGVPTTLKAAALLPGAHGAEYGCRAVVANPYEDVASVGSRISISLEWTATPVGPESTSIDLDSMLPRSVEPGESVELYHGQALAEPEDESRLAVLANIHSTTCTHMSGSREDGRAWCEEGTLDESGSAAVYRIDVEQPDGSSACKASRTYDVHIDGLVHHYVASLTQELRQSAECRGRVETRLAVQNNGPAPLVLHRQNSEIILVYTLPEP